MSRRVRFGSTTDGTLDALDGQIDTGNENGNNPDNDLVIRDSTGTIVARYNESATTWQLEQALDLQSNNVTNVGALDTEQASITNQTYIFATLPSSEDLDSIGDFERISFEADTDNIGGWDDTDNEFTAPEAGNYTINLWVTFDGGSAGDGIRIQYNGAEQQQYLQERGASESGDNRATHQMSWDVDLQADDSIFFEARNDNSTDEIVDNDLWTHLTIKRDPRGAT